MWIVPKTFTKLVVCSLILRACISKCHLEVVVLSLIICLECEEVTRAEGRNKKRNQEGWVWSWFFYSSLDVVYELSLVKRSNMQRPLWRLSVIHTADWSQVFYVTPELGMEKPSPRAALSYLTLSPCSCQLSSTTVGWGSALCGCTEILQSPQDVSRL